MTVITVSTIRILQMVMDYVASRDLTASQLAALYDCIQDAVEKFDEELLYCETEYDADAEYTEYYTEYYTDYTNAEYIL